MSQASILSLSAHITSIPVVPTNAGNGASVQVPFTVEFKTIRVGNFDESNSVSLVLEDGEWRVDWRPSLFFKDLGPDSDVRLFPLNPRRGSIVDRKGRPLATMGFLVTIGVVPKELTADSNAAQALTLIGSYLKKSPDDLKKVYEGQPPEWFIPLGDVPGTLENELHQKMNGAPGVYLRRKPIRIYPEGELASHVVGYIGHVSTEELQQSLAAEGFTVDDVVGREGVEHSAEKILGGRRGGKLAVVSQTGEVVKVIAEREAVPGNDVMLSIDIDVQRAAEKVLGKLDGSIVVMNPVDNSLLALASYPRFDPNKFVTGFAPEEWKALNTSPDSPFENRPVEGVFATGSIFKPITMSAGMEVLGYRPTDTFDCSYWWHGMPGYSLHNWTPQGTLNLIQSLTGSCDPTFYTIGLALDRKDPFALPNFARAFGLGQKTGVNGVDEVAGVVPDPKWKEQELKQPWYAGDGVNLSIGQGYLQSTPLQMANAYSAIANDGLRRTPILIQKIIDPKGDVIQTYTAQEINRIPVSPATMKAIHDGMLGVTSTVLGTANYAFATYTHPMEAKTGSAENQSVLAHAWFVGYTPPVSPTLLILLMVEGRGDSHEIAAPMARQLMEILLPSDPGPAAHPTPATPPARAATPTATAASAKAATPVPTSAPPRSATTVPKSATPRSAATGPTPTPARTAVTTAAAKKSSPTATPKR
jgi:penicillin-binding protein 2